MAAIGVRGQPNIPLRNYLAAVAAMGIDKVAVFDVLRREMAHPP